MVVNDTNIEKTLKIVSLTSVLKAKSSGKSTISNDWCILVQILVQAVFICAMIKAQKRRYYGNTNKYSNHFK